MRARENILHCLSVYYYRVYDVRGRCVISGFYSLDYLIAERDNSSMPAGAVYLLLHKTILCIGNLRCIVGNSLRKIVYAIIVRIVYIYVYSLRFFNHEERIFNCDLLLLFLFFFFFGFRF